MNCNVPTDICFSFTGFRARGGLTDDHKDGWGIAFFEGKGVRQFLDPLPSVQSPIADLVHKYPIQSKNVIAHIRKATQGRVALENTHPFMRELWGQYWIFAHNGNIPEFRPILDGHFLPVGDTDSEKVFCWMLQELQREYGLVPPSPDQLYQSIERMSKQVGALGTLNFLFSNGEALYAHCSSNLSYIIRQAPFPKARLKDQDVTVDLSCKVSPTDRIAVIVTTPLTDNEEWIKMTPGTLCLFNDGQVVRQSTTVPSPIADPGHASSF